MLVDSGLVERLELLRYLPSPAKVRHASSWPLKGCSGLWSVDTPLPPPSSLTTKYTYPRSPSHASFRLAAAGNAEAIEALRASGSSSSTFSSAPSEPGSEAGQGGGGAGGGGFTPLTVLPVLLALVGAGYCVVNDLVPQEWLLWVGGGGDGAGAGAGGSARAEGRNPGEEEGDAWSLSPLLRTLSRVAAVVPVGSANANTDAAPAAEAGGGVVSEAATASTTAAGEEGKDGRGGWGLWGWLRREDEAGAVGESDDTAVVGGEKEAAEDFVMVEAPRQDDEGERQQERPPRWLRWRAPPQAPPGPS